MDKVDTSEPMAGPIVEESEVSIIDYASVAWRYKWLILGVCVVSMLVTLLITIRLPKVYEATASLLAPRESVLGGGGIFSGPIVSGLLQQQVQGFSLPSL